MADLMGTGENGAGAGARRAPKSPDAFRTISEVASELDVPQHVLRFWETKFNQIRPLKRGGGRRYYRPEDVDLLRRIRSLLYGEGYTIKGVQKVLRENGARALIDAGRNDKPAVADPPASAPQPATLAAGSLGEPERAALRQLLDDLVELRDLLRRAKA